MHGIGVWLLLLLFPVSLHHPGTLSQTRRPTEPMENKSWKPKFFIQNPYTEFLQILLLYPFKITKWRHLVLQMLKVLSDLDIPEMKHIQQDSIFLFELFLWKLLFPLSKRSCAVYPTWYLFFLFILSHFLSCIKPTKTWWPFWWSCKNMEIK